MCMCRRWWDGGRGFGDINWDTWNGLDKLIKLSPGTLCATELANSLHSSFSSFLLQSADFSRVKCNLLGEEARSSQREREREREERTNFHLLPATTGLD